MSVTSPKILNSTEVLSTTTDESDVTTLKSQSTYTPKEVEEMPNPVITETTDDDSIKHIHVENQDENDPYALHPGLVVGLFVAFVMLAFLGYFLCHPKEVKRFRDKVFELRYTLAQPQHKNRPIREEIGLNGPDQEQNRNGFDQGGCIVDIPLVNDRHLQQSCPQDHQGLEHSAAHPLLFQVNETEPVLPGPSGINTLRPDGGFPGNMDVPSAPFSSGHPTSQLDSGSTASSMPQSLRSDQQPVHLVVNPMEHERLQLARPMSSGIRPPKTPDTHRRVQGKIFWYHVCSKSKVKCSLKMQKHLNYTYHVKI